MAHASLYTLLFLQEPVKLRFKLAVLSFSQILRLNCSEFVLKIKLFECRQFRYWTITLDASPRITNSRKSKRRSEKVVSSPQANKQMTFHVNMLLESVCIVVKNTFYDGASTSACP